MPENFQMWVPFTATLISSLISALVAILINRKQNKTNYEMNMKQTEDSMKWNSKKELLTLKCSQAEELIKNIEYIRQNIIIYTLFTFDNTEKELTDEYRKSVSQAMVASCYFPKHKILFGEIMTNCLNLSLELNDQLELERNQGNEITVEKGREIILEKHNYLAKEIQTYVTEISEEIRVMISELEETA